jgi:hypothetical protein
MAVGCIRKENKYGLYHISGQLIPEGLPAVMAHAPRIDECLHFPVCVVLFFSLLGVFDNAREMGEAPCAAA